VEVRTATIGDCEAIGRGMAEVVVEGEGRWLATESASAAELAERFRDSIEAEDHLVFVLADGEEIVGALGMHPTRTAGVLSLGMWIRRPWRRRGGGRELIEAAIAARPADVHKIELEFFPGNEAAERLYESMGFEREGVRRDHLRRRDGTLASTVIMARLFPD
jgi:RimJ/RimL family protein N-acetyltransferase